MVESSRRLDSDVSSDQKELRLEAGGSYEMSLIYRDAEYYSEDSFVTFKVCSSFLQYLPFA